MSLKIFIPDWTHNFEKPYTIPPLYPFLRKDKSNDELVSLYGYWINDIKFVSSLHDCDVVVLLYEMGYYYKYKKIAELQQLNAAANAANKLTICWSKGDEGITPPLKNFHLYRMGGYRSKNKGNQFLVPVFIEDPLPKYFNNELPVIQIKTQKPVIGFCGQGRAGVVKIGVDFIRSINKRIQRLTGKYYFDSEAMISSTWKRSQILDELESSDIVATNFIRHTKYRAGFNTKEGKAESSKIFFKNMSESQYIICYRGAGNFSVRLYETLAAGRIPVIICSDNNLPFEKEINWNMFPVIPAKQWKQTATTVYNFHAALSDNEFIALQHSARKIYEDYISYNGFMQHWIKRYTTLTPGINKLVYSK